LGLVVYPDQNTCWHYDDKIAQAHLLSATGIPTPKTWIWFDREAALNWAVDAPYPLVIKLWAGAGGTNVRLISSFEKARLWIDKLFYNGVASLADEKITLQRRLVEARNLLLRGERSIVREWHRDYVLFQEFLSGNAFDTRVTVIGKRAFGFRRFNREGDFRASGSGIIDWNPAEVAADFIRLAFEVADRLKTQSCAIDGLWRDGEAMVAEISYTYASWAVERCPGYWDPEMNWHEGILSPEEAQVQDFLLRLSSVQNNSV
jgi:glutathione synthase/RimK-type ligase-like ATP-grasp enzyme